MEKFIGKFSEVATNPGGENYEKLIQREDALYSKSDDMRSPFARDYTRILHSRAYRRLKHKTQVFFNINNDHICTRMEHVAHVESVSYTIAKSLGLNEELTRAIAIGHDVGHAPFGHRGETILNEVSKQYLGESFWHERNGLRFIDRIELLEDPYRKRKNLNLTYGVRDGIISHCGEVNENHLFPRTEFFDLNDFKTKGSHMPITWEGCVVKISDKIAYLGRDIEDANSLGFLDKEAMNNLLKMARKNDSKILNTTVIINNMITDLCKHSSPEKGICLSGEFLEQINELKSFNYKYIYGNPRFCTYEKYSTLVVTEIFNALKDTYNDGMDLSRIDEMARYYPKLMGTFKDWLITYSNLAYVPDSEKDRMTEFYENRKLYENPNDFKTYIHAVIDCIASMTDRFAIDVFNEMIEF